MPYKDPAMERERQRAAREAHRWRCGESRSTTYYHANLAGRIQQAIYMRSEACRERAKDTRRKRLAANMAYMQSMGEKWRAEQTADTQTGSSVDITETRPIPHRKMAGDTPPASGRQPTLRPLRKGRNGGRPH